MNRGWGGGLTFLFKGNGSMVSKLKKMDETVSTVLSKVVYVALEMMKLKGFLTHT